MARTAKPERPLPALPASADAFAEDGTLGVELGGWLAAMSQLAAKGDERASQALIEACQTVPRLWEIMTVLSSLAVRSWVDLLASEKPGAEIVRRTIEKEIERKRSEVAGEEASPLEQLLLRGVSRQSARLPHHGALPEGHAETEGLGRAAVVHAVAFGTPDFDILSDVESSVCYHGD